MKQGYTHGHDFVEIGGVKWATMNVGAKDVTDSGLYFAWGETKGYKPEEVGKMNRFTWENYKFGDPDRLYKYNEKDNLTTLQPQDDPVHVNWRGGWRLPTREEFKRLKKAATSEWVDNYKGSGITGLVLTDKNDASKELFFPASGYCFNGIVENVRVLGFYWSSSLYESIPKSAWNLFFGSAYVYCGDCFSRRFGFCARGVLDV